MEISWTDRGRNKKFNPLNAELNPICYLLALLGAHNFLHVSRIRVKSLTLRLIMSYIYIYIYIYIYDISSLRVNIHGSVHHNNIVVYNSNNMNKSQSLFNLTTALHEQLSD